MVDINTALPLFQKWGTITGRMSTYRSHGGDAEHVIAWLDQCLKDEVFLMLVMIGEQDALPSDWHLPYTERAGWRYLPQPAAWTS